ncbi:hypothetical protein pkur_cds_553 [Pandoravirus kuranda]|uniref:Uncharacterized protein n=1 Tax=Pandoravirus kuranda TaxID=3019033 RepID=A0AA95J3R0_9VIRU|nr:hypothetical protein pkur_cds_553 [Pandoravirus kuranda]
MDHTQSPPTDAGAAGTDATKTTPDAPTLGDYARGDGSRPAPAQSTETMPKYKRPTYGETVAMKREHVARAARVYLQCATEARQRQREGEAHGVSTLAGAWHRLAGTETPEIAAHRRQAQTEEAACYRKAASVRDSPWWTKGDDDDADAGVDTAPDTASKNAHRAARYERLASYLATQHITESEIEKYPWCIDIHLNREEEQLFCSRSKLGRLQRIFTSDGSVPGAATTRRWTDFNVYLCIDDHQYADRMAAM